jgi:hypothetical protein
MAWMIIVVVHYLFRQQIPTEYDFRDYAMLPAAA